MNAVADFAHAIADTTRWRIARLLLDEPMCVCELADILEMPQSSVSSHIQVIRRAGLLDSEKAEKRVYYRVGECYRPLLLLVGEFFEASPSKDDLLRADELRAISRLAKRAGGCCPLPKTLARLKPLSPRSITGISQLKKSVCR